MNYGGTSTIINDNPTALLTGRHLSQKHELLTIIPASSSSSTQTSASASASTQHRPIRFHDIISFHHPHRNKFLGVRKHQIGFYRSYRGQAEQWALLPAANANAKSIVGAGHLILLQNELTGELLSSKNHHDVPTGGDKACLTLYNFQAEMDVNGTMDAGLQLTFGANETWMLDLVHTPPMPNPNYVDRPFLSGTYLDYPLRHGHEQDGHAQEQAQAHNSNSKGNDLEGYDVCVQDSVLVEEILGALLGLEGNFVKYVNHEFILSCKKLNSNVECLAKKMLPTATHYVMINSFVSTRLVEFEHGRVSHALCGGIDSLLQEYMGFVTHLDDCFRGTKESVSLSGLWGNLQSCAKTLSILSVVVEVSRLLKGGALLNALEALRQEYLGDDNAKALFQVLLGKASLPYMEMLRGWLKDGNLKDPFGEFMVEESGRMKRQDFCYNIGDGSVDQWSHWYSLRSEHVLNKMQKTANGSIGSRNYQEPSKNLAMKILTTGKYWNATMLCEHRNTKAVQVPKSEKTTQLSSLSYAMSAAELSRCVDHEYGVASKTFLNIFMRDYGTLGVLAFMKQYFLLDQGDFFVHFLDMAEEELLQEMGDVSRGRVQNWMALSIQMSGGAEPSSGSWSSNGISSLDIVSSLTGAFATESLISHLDALHAMNGGMGDNEPKTPSRHVYGGANKGLTGVEAFMLDFHTVPFPLSLILSRHSIANYQLMFRHLFFAKHVERRLVGTWLDHQVIKEYHSLRKDLGKTYFLRQRMLHFMQNFVYYMMFEVIEPNYLQMETNLSRQKAKDAGDSGADHQSQKTVDDVLGEHRHFLQKTLKECLLSNRDLVRTLTKLMTTCLLFSDQMKLFIEQTQIEVEQNKIATESRQKRNRRMFESVDSVSVKREKRMNERISADKEQKRMQKQKQIDKLHRELNSDSYKRMIMRFEQVFNSNLSEFMKQLMSDSNSHAHKHLTNLCVRLDYNGFVTRSMKK